MQILHYAVSLASESLGQSIMFVYIRIAELTWVFMSSAFISLPVSVVSDRDELNRDCE